MVKGDISWTTCVSTCASSHFSYSFTGVNSSKSVSRGCWAEQEMQFFKKNNKNNKRMQNNKRFCSIINTHQKGSWYLIMRRGYLNSLNDFSIILGLTRSLNLNANCAGDHLHSWWHLGAPPAGSKKMLISSRMDVACHASDPEAWKTFWGCIFLHASRNL